jgi:hypothetical protein
MHQEHRETSHLRHLKMKALTWSLKQYGKLIKRVRRMFSLQMDAPSWMKAQIDNWLLEEESLMSFAWVLGCRVETQPQPKQGGHLASR